MKKINTLLLLIFILVLNCKDSKKAETEISETQTSILIEGEDVNYATDSTNMKGYVAYNAASKEKRPGILVVHEWWGHNDYVRERANMLAELGYTAMAVDMYGDGKLAEHPRDAGKFSGMVMSNIDVAKARFNAAMKVLKQQATVDTTKIAAIGYCFGGSVVLTMANAGEDLDAAAAFHSGVQLPIMPNKALKAKVLVANGAADPFISPESVTNFKHAMDSIGADYQYIAYEGAKHAYTSKGATALGEKFNLPLEYNEDADKKSWEALQQFLTDTFK